MSEDRNEKEAIFSCTQCGFCCHGETTVSLDAADQELMVASLGMARSEVERRYWRISGSVVQMKTIDGHCIFYDKGCTNYHGRPWRCAQWPLVPALLLDENNFKSISESCPGINKEVAYEEFCDLRTRYLQKKTRPEHFLE